MFDLAQEQGGDARLPGEAAAVDGAALVDHHLVLPRISREAHREPDPEQIFSDHLGGARKDPGRWVVGDVQEVALDHQHRTLFPTLGSKARVERGGVEAPWEMRTLSTANLARNT